MFMWYDCRQVEKNPKMNQCVWVSLDHNNNIVYDNIEKVSKIRLIILMKLIVTDRIWFQNACDYIVIAI